MNEKRRSRLREVRSMFEKAKDIVTEVLDEERDVLDNVPENLQSGWKYTQMETDCDNLDDVVDGIDNVLMTLEEVV